MIPFSMKNSKNLVILDLGENQLFGIIPSWTEDMFPTLQILRLRQNKLNGMIPSKLCQLFALQILDLEENHLMGSIPHCIGNLSAMRLLQHDQIIAAPPETSFALPPWNDGEDAKQVMNGRELEYTKNLKLVMNMDLSNNNLEGSIPDGIVSLRRLYGLNLSHNHIIREIPKNIGDMISLESFDVSYNKLSGKIPDSMPLLTSLGHLNLSYNKFSRPVPTKNQFLSLDDPYNYVGSSFLYGDSLPKKCTSDGPQQILRNKGYKDEASKKNDEKVWFYFAIAAGYATGFWGVIGILMIKKT